MRALIIHPMSPMDPLDGESMRPRTRAGAREQMVVAVLRGIQPTAHCDRLVHCCRSGALAWQTALTVATFPTNSKLMSRLGPIRAGRGNKSICFTRRGRQV